MQMEGDAIFLKALDKEDAPSCPCGFYGRFRLPGPAMGIPVDAMRQKARKMFLIYQN